MQNYKIRIPNVDMSRQVQDKAIELGWGINEYIYNNRNFINGMFIFLYNRPHSNPSWSVDETYFYGHRNPEILCQDFIKLGDLQGFKVIISRNVADNRNLLIKLLGLGYDWGSMYLKGSTYSSAYGLYLKPDKTITQTFRRNWFNNSPLLEISVRAILNSATELQPTINNTTTQIMSETTLKCITAPQKAKNITVNRDYTGILIDSDNSQVDSLREAKFFRCVNNSGIEAKYKLSLFAPIEPPKAQFPTWEQIEPGIQVNDNNEAILYFNDEEHIIYDNEYPEINSDLCCCGLNEIDGIQSLHDSINQNCNLNLLEDNVNQQRLKDLVFKTLVNNAIERNRGAFRIFTLISGHDQIDTLMQEIMAERGGTQTEYHRSTSSGNKIKVFVINL